MKSPSLSFLAHIETTTSKFSIGMFNFRSLFFSDVLFLSTTLHRFEILADNFQCFELSGTITLDRYIAPVGPKKQWGNGDHIRCRYEDFAFVMVFFLSLFRYNFCTIWWKNWSSVYHFWNCPIISTMGCRRDRDRIRDGHGRSLLILILVLIRRSFLMTLLMTLHGFVFFPSHNW